MNTNVTLPLPPEILIQIVRFAVEQPWPRDQFYPPEKECGSIQGFRQAFPQFSDIIDVIVSECVHLRGSSKKTDEEKLRGLHHTNIRDLHVEFHQDSNKSADDSLLLGLIPNLRVSSFSIESQEETLSASDELHHLLLTGFRNSDSRQTLSRLSVKVAPYLVNREVQNIAIYQNLTELCLYNNICYVFALSGSPRHDSDDTWPNPITSHLLPVLSLPRLHYLSLHIHLDTLLEMRHITSMHDDIEHLQPSEGYFRHYSDCPMCTSYYDRARVEGREDSEARAMAELRPSLRVVSFMDYWRRRWNKEEGQREIKIARSGDGILLSRD